MDCLDRRLPVWAGKLGCVGVFTRFLYIPGPVRIPECEVLY